MFYNGNASTFCHISDVVLAKSSLFRFEEGRDVEARLQKVLTYQYEKSEYYGQVRNMEKLARVFNKTAFKHLAYFLETSDKLD